MRYEGSVYRPPSEAYSLIIQATIGCTHNKCTFCKMFKDKQFRVRNIEEVEEDLEMARNHYRHIKRIFLADGNALALKTDKLERILLKIKNLFPECERVGIYGAPKDILGKSVEELEKLKDLGLGILYLGVESGSDEVLKRVKKGVTSQEMIQAGQRVVESGIELSVTLISGLGGEDKWLEHARESARVINAMNPRYLGLLTLLIDKGTEIYDEVQNGDFKILTPKDVMLETKELIENLNVKNCVFRSNHASNYVALEGILSKDKDALVKQIEESLKNPYDMKEEIFRRL